MALAVFVVLMCTIGATFAGVCREVHLQDNLDFQRIGGDWWQAYYSAGSMYGEASCLDTRVFGINKKQKLFYMETNAAIVNPYTGRSETGTVLSTAYWGDRQMLAGETHIKNHVATDYSTYLLFYKCSNGKAIIDLELKNGITRLTRKKIVEVSDILERVHVDFSSLVKRDRSSCPYTK
ncbi:uncharacterized protein LOC120334191 isoform X2 [Styela clava]|uniref:uncharacterized protein LOC120334191 n=1 Tax=Styela clava TaxID=7725 RepID=UPI00193A4D68|nr:uncharacterized protein LOC120334191 [Styela clava]